MRALAALCVAGGAVWIALLHPPAWVWALVALALAASVMWVVMGLKTRRRIASSDRYRLLLGPDGLSLVEGAEQRDVRWGSIEAIEVDEERLLVEVRVRGEEPLAIEPRYGGLGAYDLEQAIREAMETGRGVER